MRAITLSVFAAAVLGWISGATAGTSSQSAMAVTDKVIPKVALAGVSLERALAFLRKATDVDIEVDWGTLRTVGVTRQSKVKVRAEKLTLAKVLDLTVAAPRGAREPISWFLYDKTVIITTQANLLAVRIGQARRITAPRRPGRTSPARRPRRTPPAPRRAAPKTIRVRTIGKVDFQESPLEEAMDYFRDTARVNMVVHWQALAATGVHKHTPVTITLTNVKLTRALSLVLDLVNTEKDRFSRVYWDWEDGILKITTGTALDAEMITRVYTVADLLVVVPNFAAPVKNIHGSRTSTEGSGGGGTGLQQDFGKDNLDDTKSEPSAAEQKEKLKKGLADAIKASSGLELWDDGGGKGTISFLRDKMIITQSRLGFKLMGGAMRRR